MRASIVLLPGDGIGPEIVAQARKVLDRVAGKYGHSFEMVEHVIGGVAMDATGEPLPDDALEACRRADAVLLGAVGGPKWDDPTAPKRPEQGLFKLRFALGLFANLRPVRALPEFLESSPLKRDRIEGVDLLFVRELTGGLYFGEPRFRETTPRGVRAVDTLPYDEAEIRRVVRLACTHARARHKRVTSVDKANALETSRLWRQVATSVAREFPDVEMDHQLVDSCAMRLVTAPRSFDVVVTENLFGDILSDEAAVIGGSLGLLPSASLGEGRQGLFEPIHGSAPDIAGKGIANPIGTILSVAMLLKHSLGLEQEARAVEHAVEKALADGMRTADLDPARAVSTAQMGQAVVERLGSLT